MSALREDYKLSAAIDFGTTYCGVMYSSKKDYDEKNPLYIFANQNNKGDKTTSLQEPTTVLIDPQRQFHSFGLEAEKEYARLAAKKEHEEYYYFRRFKMTLHRHVELAEYTMLEDIKGKKFRAISIFEMAIGCLKSRLLATIKKRGYEGIGESDIRWVITVPAIWSEAAKQYMRDAARAAGIGDSQLLLAYEPEVASVFCKEVSVDARSTDFITALNPGQKFMVLDLGGGTVDVTLQEVLSDGSLKQLHAPSGGDWGGVGIDDAFYSLVEKLVGKDIFEEFKHQHMFEWMKFQQDFEQEKRTMTPDTSLMIQLPSHLTELHAKKSKSSLRDITKQTSLENKVVFLENNIIEIKSSVLNDFFKQTIDSIIKHVTEILQIPTAAGLHTILLVGGFAESNIVNSKITKAFNDKKVIVPHEAGSAVLKGAVIFGHNPKSISARISPFTYGLKTRRQFNPKEDEERKKTITKEGKAVVTTAFDKHIEIGETIYIAKELTLHNFYVIDTNNPEVFWKVYRSSKKNPRYCDEECQNIGQLTIHLQQAIASSGKRELGVRMVCRGTELEAIAVDKQTGYYYRVSFDFLKRMSQ
ncbi:heat shock 70 kDa protein 12A-like [Saccostrea echinata]|uniref:heat shock 70 kDa protein 12A-like n=1 Tax=Saccostrea echinata TaxID=191078 RepID=UPI002A82160E|nr:heat shock 70 kDa protein 12A-like [Saccostrea echinata]